jgi:hypothetical protein
VSPADFNQGDHMFDVEKGVPLPARTEKQKGIRAFMRALDVGDSFCAPADYLNRIRCAAVALNKKTAMRYVTRTLEDKSIRVWRVE